MSVGIHRFTREEGLVVSKTADLMTNLTIRPRAEKDVDEISTFHFWVTKSNGVNIPAHLYKEEVDPDDPGYWGWRYVFSTHTYGRVHEEEFCSDGGDYPASDLGAIDRALRSGVVRLRAMVAAERL